MTTAKTRPKADPLAEIEAREKAWADAKAEASRLGSEWGAKARELEALHDQRRRLIDPRLGNPGLVDHNHAPNPDVKDNPVAAIDAQVAELGDLGDLQARVHHARRIEQSAKQAKDDYAAAHLDELRAAIEPDAEAAVAGVVAVKAAEYEAGSVLPCPCPTGRRAQGDGPHPPALQGPRDRHRERPCAACPGRSAARRALRSCGEHRRPTGTRPTVRADRRR